VVDHVIDRPDLAARMLGLPGFVVLAVGHGFRNFDNYRLRLLPHGGIDWHNHQPLRIRSRRPRLVA